MGKHMRGNAEFQTYSEANACHEPGNLADIARDWPIISLRGTGEWELRSRLSIAVVWATRLSNLIPCAAIFNSSMDRASAVVPTSRQHQDRVRSSISTIQLLLLCEVYPTMSFNRSPALESQVCERFS